mmetsp:Transcript_571/g.575  ORF Transcript_571/g.575 Transcript_571/m.575 type:complete len:185 (+) Transcript_571:106-660(+)
MSKIQRVHISEQHLRSLQYVWYQIHITYNAYEDYIYCKNASDRGESHLSQRPGKEIHLGHNKEEDVFHDDFRNERNGGYETGRVCEWNLKVDNVKEDSPKKLGCSQDAYSEVTVEIIRDPRNLEEIYLEIGTNTGWRYLDSKTIAKCGSEVLTFYNTTSVKVRAKRMSEESNYSIIISEKSTTT